MDPIPPDQPQPPVQEIIPPSPAQPLTSEAQEAPAAETGLVRRYIDAHRTVYETEKIIGKRVRQISDQARSLLTAVGDPSKNSEFMLPDGRKINRGVVYSGRDRQGNDVSRARFISFQSPANPAESIVVTDEKIAVRNPDDPVQDFEINTLGQWDAGGRDLDEVNYDYDLLDLTQKEVDYFLQHSAELRPVEQPVQAPPVPPTTPTV